MSQFFFKDSYSDGVIGGQDSIFQNSFDRGYEDGFKMGFLLAMAKKEKAGRGLCDICKNQLLLDKSEMDVREIFRKTYENEKLGV